LCVSGCFYRRLLAFKKQLKNFNDYFVLQEDDAVSMICKKPIMLTEDTERFMGSKPTAILGEAPNAIYEYRMVKQYAPNQSEEGNFDFTYQVQMKNNKIERFVLDKRFFVATPKPMFVRICKMFGHAKVNLAKRSVRMGKIASKPYLQESVFLNAEEVRQLSGIPFKVVQNTYVYRYRLQQEGDKSSWPVFVTMVTFTDQGEFMRGESTVMGGIAVERPLEMPTHPVPGNATAVNPKTLTTLRWKGGHRARTHRVYGGGDKHNVMLLGEVSDANEIELPPRDPAALYYWRVDAIDQEGTLHPGELWSFFPGALVGHWTFDEASGRIAHDLSGAGNHGTLQGDATFKPGAGILGGAVCLDGVGDEVHVNDISLNAHTITMTAWIKGHQVSGGAWLIHFEDALWGASLYACRKDHLHYTWRCDSPNVGDFHSRALPKEEWVFIAGVVDYDQATLYVYTGSRGLKASVNESAHQPQSVSKLIFGHFIGLMDDIRIYNHALTRAQIQSIINERSR